MMKQNASDVLREWLALRAKAGNIGEVKPKHECDVQG
jgi:hypothetical protein